MNNPNPIIPWNAKTYFADPSKWEVIQANGKIETFSLPSLLVDGSLMYSWEWKGMREKYTPRKVWINVYSGDRFGVYSSREHADYYADDDRLWCQEVELIPPASSEPVPPGANPPGKYCSCQGQCNHNCKK